MADRDHCLHLARVYLRESAARRDSRANRNFHWQLFAWAQAARRRAAELAPQQRELFA